MLKNGRTPSVRQSAVGAKTLSNEGCGQEDGSEMEQPTKAAQL